jgi:uncharacterized membrane protein (UPF0127 family)
VKIANPVSSWVATAAVLLALGLGTSGCGKAPEASPVLKTAWDPFKVDLGGHPVSLLVAILPAEQERGLMQRPDLGRDEGMIFVYTQPQKQNFWMRNTPEPLDIAYLGPDGAIDEIYHMLPLDERGTASRSDRIQFAVEMPLGWYERNGVRPGARVDMKALSDAVRARGFDPPRFGLPPAGP